jgi:2-methylcitrate dehydratase PrpD
MSAITDFAAFVAAPRPISAATRETVRLHIIDTLGALLASSRTGEGQALLRFRSQAGASRDMAVNLMTLAALTRLSEIDDIHLASMTTPGSIVIPGALAIAAGVACDDRDRLVEAIVAGYEAMTRLGLALDGPAILYRGIWTTYFAAPFGIAAVASRLLRLDAAQTANALALALTYTAPGVGHHNAPTTSRWLAAGHAARNGLAAAQAAQAGFTADTNMLDGAFLPGVYAITPKAAALTEGLGTRETLAEVSFKPWCAARQTMAATQALKEIMAGGVRAEEITAVKVAVLPPHRKMIDHGVTPGDRASYLTSLPYNMAVAAVAPQLADALSPNADDVPAAVPNFISKISIEADESLLAGYPREWAAHVTVTTPSGSREKRVASVPGDPTQPFGEAEVTAKFLRFVALVIGQGEASTLLGALDQAPATVLELVERALSASAASSRPR